MSEELQSLVQIIELYGKGLGGLGRALRFSAKGAAKGVADCPGEAFTTPHETSLCQ